MAIIGSWFGNALTGQFGTTAARRVDWVTDTIKCSLHSASYSPNQDTDVFFSAATNEVTGTGYTAGGVTLSGKSVTYDSASNETRLLAGDANWTSATFTTAKAVIYKDTGSAATSPLLGWIDFGGNETVTTGNFTITFDITGALKLTVA